MRIEKSKFDVSQQGALGKKQIYILDDDESVLCSLKLLMVSYGFVVYTFSTAKEYFSTVPNSILGCLILDVHISGLNGWDTLQRLIEAGSKRPVIVISSDKSDIFKEMALKAGAVWFLQKPFEDHYLLHMVNQVFNKIKRFDPL